MSHPRLPTSVYPQNEYCIQEPTTQSRNAPTRIAATIEKKSILLMNDFILHLGLYTKVWAPRCEEPEYKEKIWADRLSHRNPLKLVSEQGEALRPSWVMLTPHRKA